MADQVVLLHQGHVEQCARPRDIYAQPATTFAARFIGTPAMNIVRLQGRGIAGSDCEVAPGMVAGSAYPQLMGIRPELIAVTSDRQGVLATVQGFEYLGADLVLRCLVGTELLTVRAPGNAHAGLEPGHSVYLQWPATAEHWFDGQGRRIEALSADMAADPLILAST